MHAMKRTLTCLVALLMTSAAHAADTVAITEFFNQPIGEQAARQWVELYNYGTTPAEMKGWRIGTNANAMHELPMYTIPPGGYAIVLGGGRNLLPIDEAKRVFETEWLNGKPDSRVLQIEQGDIHLGRGGGEITLMNRQRKVIWQLGYRGDGKDGHATVFADNRFRLVTKFGKGGDPGVVRDGNDAGITGGEFLGYEGNWIREDKQAYQSDVAGLQQGFMDLYGKDAPNGQAQPGFGSPLRGHYTTVGSKP